MGAAGAAVGPANRTAVTAAGAAVLVALVGTAAVLAVQTRANADLQAANTELAVANAKVTRANTELAASNQRERARFELAQEAIRMFHTGVSEDLLLKQKEFGALRTKLLRGAQEFYRKLEGLLGGQADRDSRLGAGARLLRGGRAHEAARLDEGCAGDAPACPGPVRRPGERGPGRRGAAARGRTELRRHRTAALVARAKGRGPGGRRAGSRNRPGSGRGRPRRYRTPRRAGAGRTSSWRCFSVDNSRVGEGLEALERARAIQEDLVRSNPSDEQLPTRARPDMRRPGHAAGRRRAGRDEALAVYDRARDLVEGLFRANPTDARIAHEVARTLGNMAIALDGAGRQNEALAAYDRAREVLGMIGDANPTLLSVTRDRAWIDTMTAGILIEAARDAEALPVLERARKARETLVKAGTSVIRDQTQLIRIHSQIAGIHARAGRTSEALASLNRRLAVAIEARRCSPRRPRHPGRARRRPTWTSPISSPRPASLRKRCRGTTRRWRSSARWSRPNCPSSRYYLADGLRRRGIVLQKCGRPAEAVSAFREAIAILEGLANPTPGNIYDLACSQSLLSGVAYRCRLRSHGRRRPGRGGQGDEEPAPGRRRRLENAGPHENFYESAESSPSFCFSVSHQSPLLFADDDRLEPSAGFPGSPSSVRRGTRRSSFPLGYALSLVPSSLPAW